MSRKINQPINQVRLTNVAVVRMNRNGKRFEIACYRNKVMDYRKGLETDLSEVLQTDRIFTNVSKGQFAKHADLQKCFQTKNEEAIAAVILRKGQLQVSDLERAAELEATLAQIATWVANHCVHPQSQRPYTVSQIKHALGKQYQVQPHKPIKKQYLDCVKFLKTVIPIERAKMELALSWNNNDSAENVDNDTPDTADQQLDRLIESEESLTLVSKDTNSTSATTRCVLLADPSLYRVLDDLAKTLPQGKLEILRSVVTQQGDVDLEMEIERKTQLQQQQQTQQQQQIADAANPAANSKEDSTDDDDEDIWAPGLVAQQQQKASSTNAVVEDEDDDDDEEADIILEAEFPQAAVNNRKNQGKQKKKQSKKAKRRQKEQEAEREARVRAEQERQEERRRARGGGGVLEEQPVVEANAAAQQQQSTATTGGGGGKACNTCGGSFPTAASYRAHFKSDWHRFNQKLKLQGCPPVSEEEFNLCDAESFFGAV